MGMGMAAGMVGKEIAAIQVVDMVEAEMVE